MTADYALTTSLPEMDFDTALRRVVELLADEGFGVLTEIDVRQTLKTKLGVDHPRYTILGACNPPLAHTALQAEPFIGVLLPCNVVVMEDADGGTVVAAFNPTVGFDMVDNPGVKPVASEVRERIQKVLDRLG